MVQKCYSSRNQKKKNFFKHFFSNLLLIARYNFCCIKSKVTTCLKFLWYSFTQSYRIFLFCMIKHLVELVWIAPMTKKGRKMTKIWHVHDRSMMNTMGSFEGCSVVYQRNLYLQWEKYELLKKSYTDVALTNHRNPILFKPIVFSPFLPVMLIHTTMRGLEIKLKKMFNGTFMGRKNMLQGFRIHFVWNHRLKAIEMAS